MSKNFLLTVIIFSGALVFLNGQSVLAYVASSTHYQIEKDSINFGGTDFSTSTNYSLNDTFGEIATGSSTDLTKLVQAGYRSADDNYFISITSTGNTTLSPNISGSGGGSSAGSATWQVTTNNPAGYNLYLKSATNPSLKSGSDHFDDYTPAVAGVPDLVWQTIASSARFGFSVKDTDATQTFKNNGVTCNAGTSNTVLACWLGLSTSYRLVAGSTSANFPAGTDLVVNFKAEIGANKVLNNGNYIAGVTAMALVL